MAQQTSYWFGTKCPALLHPRMGDHEMMLRSGLTVMNTRSCRNCGIYEDATPYMPDGRPMPIRMIDQMIGGQPQVTWSSQGFTQQGGNGFFTHNPSGGSQYHTHQVTQDNHGNWHWRL